MALTKCRECGSEVSSKAKSCPSCGIKDPAKSRTETILALVIVGLVVWLIGSQGGGPKPSPESAPQPVNTAAQIAKMRLDRIEAGFSSWDGSHRELTKLIKSAMNDPDSYEHVKTAYSDKGDHLLVKTSFRGKNAFGGKVVNWIIVEATIDGNVLRVVEEGH